MQKNRVCFSHNLESLIFRAISMDRCSRVSFSKHIHLRSTISLRRLTDNINACIDNGTLHQRLFVCSVRQLRDKFPLYVTLFPFYRLLVRLGEFDLLSSHDGATPIDIVIERRISHEDYANNIIANDIGLLKLRNAAPVNGEYLNAISFSVSCNPIELTYIFYCG